MVGRVNTGVPLPGGVLNAPGDERQSQNTFFNAQSISNLSHRFSVDESPYYIKAFGLGDVDSLSVLMVTDTPTGELTELFRLNGTFVGLLSTNNCLVIDIPGVYRLLLNTGLGTVTVVGGTTAMSYWSWGLRGFADVGP